jgi:hypothetical protein
MDKSAIYLDKQQMDQAELIQHIKKCPILKHLQIKKGGVFLGAQTRPNKTATFHHIKSRIGKAKAAQAEMMLRGFSQKHLGRRTITKILTSTISPLLTYALEAFPLNTSDYDLIDEVLEEIIVISKTTRHHSKHTTWNFYDQHITPPSEIIRRNKISLHIKAKNSKTGLLKETLSNTPKQLPIKRSKHD